MAVTTLSFLKNYLVIYNSLSIKNNKVYGVKKGKKELLGELNEIEKNFFFKKKNINK